MKNFGNCIWLTTRKNRYKYLTNGFQLHMTIFSHLNVEEAFKYNSQLKNNKYIITLGETIYEKSDNFYCIYRKIKNISPCLDINVKNPHISFYYSYKPICTNMKKKIEEKARQK